MKDLAELRNDIVGSATTEHDSTALIRTTYQKDDEPTLQYFTVKVVRNGHCIRETPLLSSIGAVRTWIDRLSIEYEVPSIV